MKKTRTPNVTTNEPKLRQLPAIEKILGHPLLSSCVQKYSRPLTTLAAQHVIASERQELKVNRHLLPSLDQLANQIVARLSLEWPSFAEEVINASGIVLHTHLGRAPLSTNATKEITNLATRYFNVESDLQKGERGERNLELRKLISLACGSEDSLAVNNNAAAMLLVLVTLACGKEAIVSRGELVQIGGGFRIPEILKQSGVILREVGTTNHTTASDYAEGINERTALILKVNPSNFVQSGFVNTVSVEELSSVARSSSIPLVHDIGSGALLDTAEFGLTHELTVRESLLYGADLVCFSGDKLLGGPQAGIVVGKRIYTQQMLTHPLMRVVRLDKLQAIALSSTFKSYIEHKADELPLWQMIKLSKESIKSRAMATSRKLKKAGINVSVVGGYSLVGGGTMPGQKLPTYLIRITPLCHSAEEVSRRFRLSSPALISRIEKNAVVLDLRTVFPDQDDRLAKTITDVLTSKE